MTDDALDKLAEPAARKAAALPRWLVAVLAALLAVFVLCAAGATWVLVSQHSQIAALDAHAYQSDSDARKLAEQVKGLGAVPVVEPSAGPAGTPGAAGATGATGPQGIPGQKGDPGATGPLGPSGPTGQPGVPGVSGQDGVPGVDGAHGQDGAAGPAGPAGPQGEPGPAGPQGPQGEQGPPGPTCPDGYTAQARQQATETWWVCVADETTEPSETP